MKTNAVTAHPLSWPDGWRRAERRTADHPFKSSSFDSAPGGQGYQRKSVSFEKARRSLLDELRRLGASALIFSSNLALRLDGQPYADAPKTLKDPGVAIYFTFKGKPMVMAQDIYTDIAANTRSLALAIEGLRQMNRHGGAQMMERAFAGFSALPPPDGAKPKRPWWEVLHYSADPADRELLSEAEVDARFKTLAKRLHPDGGGEGASDEAMAELNQARTDAIEELTKEN